MKLLKKVLLVNWHLFSKEIFEVDNINFLTGKNASGKSTVVDAIQLVLLGDTRGNSFNKSASSKSGRTVISYLKGQLGDYNGVPTFIRNGDFSSYIALEFYDDINNYPFVVGFQYDVNGDNLSPHPFLFDGTIPEDCFVGINKRALDFKDFKEYANSHYEHVSFPDALKTYQEELRKKLGQLSTRFFPLFKKAVPFEPIHDIRKFITEFVCDVSYDIRDDLTKMQDNVRNYTSLETEAKIIQNKITSLKNIKNLYEDYASDSIKTKQADYLFFNLQIASAKRQINNLQKKLHTNAEKIKDIETDSNSLKSEISSWTSVRDELVSSKNSSSASMQQKTLSSRKDEINRQIESIKNTFEGSANRLIESFNEFKNKALAIKNAKLDNELLSQCLIDQSEIIALADSVISKSEALSKINQNNINMFSTEQIADLCQTVSNLKDIFDRLRNYLETIISSKSEELNNIQNALNSLQRGNKIYPRSYVEFKQFVEDELSRRHGKHIEMNFVADLMEINDKKWQNVLEVYLNTQKFAFVIDETYFQEALQVYNANKDRFYDVLILDSKKLLANASRFPMAKGSLAEEIITDNLAVRTYINSLIGTLMKVDKLENINDYDRGITATGMLYQQFAARQMNMAHARTPFIGTKAKEDLIKSYEYQISTINEQISNLRSKSSNLYVLSAFNNLSNVDISYHFNNLTKIFEIDRLNDQLVELDSKISAIDMSDVELIEAKIKDAETEINSRNEKILEFARDKGSLEKDNETISSEKIVNEQVKIDQIQVELDQKFTPEWIEENVSDEMKEMIEYVSEDQINSKLAQARNIRDALGAKRRRLMDARTNYVKAYNVSVDLSNIDSNEAFDEELNRYEGITLPEYINRIADAKAKSYDQFKEDLLAKLKASIEQVTEQIGTLNTSLGNFKFGHDSYEFVVKPNQTYIEIYNMIMDELLMRDARTNSQAFNDKYKDIIEDFFTKITEAPGYNDEERRQIIDKNIALYTDYRTYLDFDLLVKNDDTKTIQSLASSMNTKSGGETQTPFYISILASIANEYRIGMSNEESNTPRLILFDEAFNKMDTQRIKESVDLLKKFNLQAILIAPPEKVSEIAPYVDRILCTIRRKDSSFIKWYHKDQIDEIML